MISEDLIEKFLEYLKYQRNYSDYTVVNYHDDLKTYQAYLEKEMLSYQTVEYSDLRRYLMYLKEDKKQKNSSVCRNLSALRSFYQYLIYKDVIDHNPFLYIESPKCEKRLPRYFEYNELEELFLVPDKLNPLGQRDLVILELLYASGVRVGELVHIKVKDINMKERKMVILGKGNKERIAYFGEYAFDALNLYLHDGYQKLNPFHLDYLLINNKKTPLSERGVRDILNRLIAKTSLNKNISPHMLRHSFATHLLNEGCDILSVQKLLGHSSIAATGIYTHVSTSHLKDVYYQAFPRAKMNSNKRG